MCSRRCTFEILFSPFAFRVRGPWCLIHGTFTPIFYFSFKNCLFHYSLFYDSLLLIIISLFHNILASLRYKTLPLHRSQIALFETRNCLHFICFFFSFFWQYECEFLSTHGWWERQLQITNTIRSSCMSCFSNFETRGNIRKVTCVMQKLLKFPSLCCCGWVDMCLW